MENNNNNCIFCPRCGARNNAGFSFCMSCGAPLNGNTADADAVRSAPVTENINGIPVSAVTDYVGKNSRAYIHKFIKYSYGQKAGWNWPVFLFGFLLKMPFIWFFYRKMYKLAGIFLAISIVLTAATAATSAYTISHIKDSVKSDIVSLIDNNNGWTLPEYIDSAESILQHAEDDFRLSDNYAAIYYLQKLISMLNLANAVIAAVLANYLYYKKTFSDLENLKKTGDLIPEIVMTKGGTSNASGILSGIICGIGILVIADYPKYLLTYDIVRTILKNFH